MKITEERSRSAKVAFRFSLALVTGLFVYKFFRIGHGYWIPMTIGMLYIGSREQGMVVKYAAERFMGTLVGLIVAFWYVRIFMYSYYRWGYVAPILLFMIFWNSRNNVVKTLFITILVVLMLSIGVGYDPNMKETIFMRLFCTWIAGAIVVFYEFFIFREAGQVKEYAQENVGTAFLDLARSLEMISSSFLSGIPVDEDELGYVHGIMDRYFSLKRMNYSMRYELGKRVRSKNYYSGITRSIKKVCHNFSVMMTVANHGASRDLNDREKERIHSATGLLAGRLRSIASASRSREKPPQGPLKEKVSALLLGDKEPLSGPFRPVILFNDYLIRLAGNIDLLSGLIFSQKDPPEV